MALNSIGPATFTGFTTPPAMSSFLATETIFPSSGFPSLAPSAALNPPKSALSTSAVAPSASSKISAISHSTLTKNSSSSTPTSSPSSQTSTAGALASSSSNGSGPTSSITTSPTGSTLTTSFTSPAAVSTAGSSVVLSEHQKCSGMSCSPGLQAAVAVPVTLIILGFIIAFIIFARRRRRRDSSSAASNGGEPRGSKWARHLRVFSFDAELLIGGRSSTAGSVRSHPTCVSHPSVTSLRSQQPSVRSLESPAPPYRDALAAGNVQMSERPDSQLTAPPPYIADRASYGPKSRLSAISQTTTAAANPFADPEDEDAPVSPINRRSVRRSSYQPVGADADDASFVSSQPDVLSEAGSIRQAEVARRVSGAKRA